jgi:hypothetical protein
VLALPAETGGGRERLLHHGGGIDEHLYVAAPLRHQPARQRLQSRLDDLVIVVALGVDRDGTAVARRQNRQRVATLSVVHPQHDDRARLRPQRARIAATSRGRRHPFHVAMRARREKLLQPFQRLRDRVGTRDADDVEAMGRCGRGQRRLQTGRIIQKSRLA